MPPQCYPDDILVNLDYSIDFLCMDAALAQLRRQGIETKADDVARLSPLGHETINFLGKRPIRAVGVRCPRRVATVAQPGGPG